MRIPGKPGLCLFFVHCHVNVAEQMISYKICVDWINEYNSKASIIASGGFYGVERVK